MQMPSQPASASALWKSAGKPPSLSFFSQYSSSKRVQILATASRIDSWLAVSAKSMRSLLVCGRRFGGAVADHRGDFIRGEAGLAQNLLAMLVEARRKPNCLGRRLRPPRRYLHAADRAFRRMLDHGKISGRSEMRISQHAFEVVHRHDRDIGLCQQFLPLGRRPRLEDARELAIDGVDIACAAGKGCEFRVGAQIVAAGMLEEAFP